MPPDKAARRRIHDALCVREQGTRNMPAAPYFEGIAAGGSQEAIYVLFRGNIVAGMKICRDPPGVPDGYRIGQTDTQSLRDPPDGNRRGQLLRAVCRDRAAEHAGMNAAVRATASGDVTRESEQIGCGAVKRPLHRGTVRLHLIAAKRPPVKGYVQQQLLLHLCPPLQPDIV